MRASGLHPREHTERARKAFVASGYDSARREKQIAALDCKDWKGNAVYRIRCHGSRGKGPHDQWIGEAQLWSLVSLDNYLCPFHIGDQPPRITQPDLLEAAK